MIRYNREYNHRIRNICDNNKTSYMNIFRSERFKYLRDYIMDCTEKFFPDPKTRFSKRINFILNEYQDYPKCRNPNCNNRVFGVEQIRYNEKWTEYCCNRCAQSDKTTINKIKTTKKKHYGNENYNGDVEELKKRNNEKYGTDYYFQTDEFKRKSKLTMLKSGYDHPMHSDRIKNEISNRYRNKTGYRYPLLNPLIMRKAKLLYFYDNMSFKSSWELAYYIWLKDNGIRFEFQPNIHFKYKDDKGKIHCYYPDFKVNEKYVEIKGDQFIKKNGEYRNPYDKSHKTDDIYENKRKCMIENNIIVISRKEIGKYISYCRKKFKCYRWHIQFKNVV